MAVTLITQSFTGTGVGTFAPVGAIGAAIRGVANLTIGGTAPVGTVKLEKSYDNGTSWFDVSVDALGTLASWVLNSTEVSVLIEEPEGSGTTAPSGVIYRGNCTAFTSGTITMRISQ